MATTDLTVGSHCITAFYSGDVNYSAAASQTPVSIEVLQATSTPTLTAATTVASTTLTAKVVVTSPGNPPFVGTVAFYDGFTLLGTEPVVNGVATLSVLAQARGVHSFGAVSPEMGNSPRARRRWSSRRPTRRSTTWLATYSTASRPTCS